MNFSFTTHSPSSRHEVWRDSGGGINFSLLTTLDAGVVNYSDATESPVNTYKVCAIGEGDPSDFVIAGTYFMQEGAVLLQADNGNWYFVRLSGSGDNLTVEIDQTPTTAPPYGAASIVFFEQLTSDQVTFSLVVDSGAITWEINAGGDNGIWSLPLLSDDGNFYSLEIEIDDSEYDTFIDPTPLSP